MKRNIENIWGREAPIPRFSAVSAILLNVSYDEDWLCPEVFNLISTHKAA